MQYYTIKEGYTDERTKDQVCMFIHLQAEQIYRTQPAITCSKLTIGTLEQGVKYVQSKQ